MAFNDNVRTANVALVAFVGVVIVFAIVVLLQVVYYNAEIETERTQLDEPVAELGDLLAQQRAVLASYAWVDEKKGVTAIPIDRAMELVVADLNRPKPKPTEAKPAESAVAKPPRQTPPADRPRATSKPQTAPEPKR